MRVWGEIRGFLPLLLTVLPAWGAAWAWLISRHGAAAARRTAVINSSLTLAVALIMAADFLATGDDQLIGFSVPWLETGPVRMTCAYGVDGLSLWPMVILALAGWTIVLAAESCCVNWTASAYAGLLFGQSLGLGIFAAQDFVLYFCCCAGWSWWSFAAVGRPGGSARRAAAQRYLLISSLGNGLVGIAATCLVVCQAGMARELYGKPGKICFEFSHMITGLSRSIHSHEIAWEFWSGYQPAVLLFCLGGLWLRWPMFPWHAWWPAVMSRARAPMAALFGAATALQAGYLLFRFIVPFCSDPGAEWPDWVCWVAAGTVFYAGVLACAQDQLRSLAGYLALSGLATALIAGVAGTAWTSLMGWQIALIVSLAVTSTWLLIGRLEQTFETTAISALGAIARSAPVTFSLLCVGLGLMTASPAVSLINGQAVSSLLRLSQTTGPTWAMILGQLLGAWAALRAMLSIGFGPTAGESAKQGSLRSWKLATGGLLTLAVIGGVAPALWQQPIRPTWVKIHDPFADAIVPAGVSPSAPHPHTSLRERHHRETRKPPILAGDRRDSWAGWLIAPTVWLICGGLLWGTSRLLVTVRGVNWLAAGCVALGLMTEFAAYAFSIPNHTAPWQDAAWWSSALVGLAALTLRSESALPMSSSIGGRWLLRIGAIGWAAVTGHLVVCGLAWELAEFASGASLDSTAASHSKERVRRLISSLCFWLGIGCCRAVAGTWDISEITAGFQETAAELTPGGLRLGFVALFLMISGVCCRCGLAPWSLRRRDTGDRVTFSASTLDQWLAEMTGLVVLLKIVLMMRGQYGEPMFVLLSIAGAGTAVWSGLSLVGEEKIRPLVRNLSTRQFSGVVIALAWLALANRFEDAASPIRLGHESALAIWAAWVFSFSVMMTGLTALLIRLGVDDQPDLYLENYAGLFSRRPWEASALTGCLLSVSGGIPFALFWPQWLSGIMAAMTPMLGSTTLHSPTLVALSVAVCFLLAGLMQLSVVSRWIWTILFDPAVSLPKISANRWQVALIAGMAAYCLAGGIQPAGLWSLWLSIGR